MKPVRASAILLGLVVGSAMGGCDTLFGPEDPASIEISADRSTLEVPGDSLRLRAVVRDEDGDRISGASVSWTSRAPEVLTVDPRGVASGVMNGTAWVVASSGGVSDSLEITVDTPIACAPVGDLVVPDTLDGSLAEGDCRLRGMRGDFWRLTLDRTTEVTIELKSSELDAILVLFDDAGTLMALDDDGGIGLNARLHDFIAAGTYYIYATSYQPSGIGPYRISAFEGGYPSPCPATATLALPDTVVAQVGLDDCLHNGFYIDVWRLRVPSDTTLVLHAISDEITPFLALADTLGEVFEARGIGPGSDAWIEIPVRAGSYDLWVSDAMSTGATGSYTLSARLGRSVLTCATEGDIPLGLTVAGELTYGDCYVHYGSADGWDLRLEELTTLRMTMRGPSLHPTILVSDAEGRVVHALLGDSSRVEGEVSLGPGSYRVWARAGHDRTGSYTLNVGIPGRLPPCEPTGSMIPGDTVQGTLSASDCLLPEGERADLWTVRLETPTTLTVDVRSAEFDAFLIIADSIGHPLHRDDDAGSNGNARLTVELEPGSYQLWATSYSSGSTGAYGLSMVPVEPGATAGAPVLKPRPPGAGGSPSRALPRPAPPAALPWEGEPATAGRPLPKDGPPPPWLRMRR